MGARVWKNNSIHWGTKEIVFTLIDVVYNNRNLETTTGTKESLTWNVVLRTKHRSLTPQT